MMLVHADGVEAALGGIFELVHEVVVHVVRPAWVEQRRMDVDPHRGMLLVEVIRKLRVRHQMEPHELHGTSSLRLGPKCMNVRSPAKSCQHAFLGRATKLFFGNLFHCESYLCV